MVGAALARISLTTRTENLVTSRWRLHTQTPRAARHPVHSQKQQPSTVQWRLFSSLSTLLTAWRWWKVGRHGWVEWTHVICYSLAPLRRFADHSVGLSESRRDPLRPQHHDGEYSSHSISPSKSRSCKYAPCPSAWSFSAFDWLLSRAERTDRDRVAIRAAMFL